MRKFDWLIHVCQFYYGTRKQKHPFCYRWNWLHPHFVSFVSGSGSRQYLEQFSKNQINCTKSCFFNVRAAHFPESCPFIFDFMTFYTFYVGSVFKSGSGTGSGNGTVSHSGSCCAKAKSYGFYSSVSGSTTLVARLEALNTYIFVCRC